MATTRNVPGRPSSQSSSSLPISYGSLEAAEWMKDNIVANADQ
jgi:hypothetical protein